MPFGKHGVTAQAGKKLSRKEMAELKRAKEQEDVNLRNIEAAQDILTKDIIFKGDDDNDDAEDNVENCDKAIDHLMLAQKYDEDQNATYFWRAEAYRIRAICRRNAKGKEDSRTETRLVAAAKLNDLRCALGDVDHCLRFYDNDPEHKESASQSWVVWQLRGRIRAQLKDPDYIYDFRTAADLDPDCAMTYILWGRCLWREKKFDEAIAKYKEGCDKPHNPDVKLVMDAELKELIDQEKAWAAWEAAEADRCKCVVM